MACNPALQSATDRSAGLPFDRRFTTEALPQVFAEYGTMAPRYRYPRQQCHEHRLPAVVAVLRGRSFVCPAAQGRHFTHGHGRGVRGPLFSGRSRLPGATRNVCATDWSSSRETVAYSIISAWYVIRTIGGNDQLHAWLESLECLANHLEAQFGPDGLIHHRDSGSMWFDTYNMQGADVYSMRRITGRFNAWPIWNPWPGAQTWPSVIKPRRIVSRRLISNPFIIRRPRCWRAGERGRETA